MPAGEIPRRECTKVVASGNECIAMSREFSSMFKGFCYVSTIVSIPQALTQLRMKKKENKAKVLSRKFTDCQTKADRGQIYCPRVSYYICDTTVEVEIEPNGIKQSSQSWLMPPLLPSTDEPPQCPPGGMS